MGFRDRRMAGEGEEEGFMSKIAKGTKRVKCEGNKE
jgi:hypothetical protein